MYKKREALSLLVSVIGLLVFTGCYEQNSSDLQAQIKETISMRLTSPHFGHTTPIPSRFTCEGENISSSLEWDQVPEGTKSFVLIVDDPDAPDPKAPKMTWVHGGPCPPIGEHRYFFKLFALDTTLDLKSGATKNGVVKAMEGHILTSTELIGLYKKRR